VTTQQFCDYCSIGYTLEQSAWTYIIEIGKICPLCMDEEEELYQKFLSQENKKRSKEITFNLLTT
jgi:hypothetical protein